VSETRRSIVALVVAFAAILLYVRVILPWIQARRPEEPARQPPPAAPAEVRPAPAAAPEGPKPGAPPEPHVEAPPEPHVEAPPEPDELTVEWVSDRSLFDVVLTNRGAAIRSVTLRDYYTFPPEDPQPLGGDLTLVDTIETGKLSLTVREVAGHGDLDTRMWVHETVPEDDVPEGYAGAVRFGTVAPQLGLALTKTFLFREPGEVDGRLRPGRDIELRLTVRNVGAKPTLFKYRVRSGAGIVPEPDLPDPALQPAKPGDRRSRDVKAVVAGLAGDEVDVTTYTPGKVETHLGESAPPIYAGVQNRYFAAVVEPLGEEARITSVVIERVGEHNITADLEMESERLGPGEAVTRRFLFLVAPRTPEVLRAYPGHRFEALLAQGWLGPIKKLLTWLLHAFHEVLPNYGWSIVLLTICVRLVLHPLTLKSQKAMHRVQQLQPLIREVKEKYKHDKRLQQQEQMKLMREHGANPLGGCLPMLLQLPIFIGLWRSLYENPGLRQAPFLLWMRDLSKADNLLSFEKALPLIGQSFNLLPLLVAAAMILQQRLTPKSPDPQAQQTQKMMTFMPILFAVMLYRMPSGLMVYFLCSSTFGMLEHHWIRRRLTAAAAEVPPETPAVPVERKRQKPTSQRRKKRRRR